MISLKNEILESRDIYAFNKVYNNIPYPSPFVELNYYDGEYDVILSYKGIAGCKAHIQGSQLYVDLITWEFVNGCLITKEQSMTIDLPRGIYSRNPDVKEVHEGTKISFKKL